MGGSLRILTVFGTRPEAIKLFPLLHALADDPRFESRLCTTGQHREMLGQVLGIAGIEPDIALGVMRRGQSLDALVARLHRELSRVIARERPDWVIVQGDTATTLCAAAAAHEQGVRVAHVEAGLRSGDFALPYPEEINRYLVARIAQLHLAPTAGAAQALREEGVDPARIHVTGNTVVDALHWITNRMDAEPALSAGLAELEARYAGRRIVGVTCHRRENWGDGVRQIAQAVRTLAVREDIAFIVPLHSNPQLRDIFGEALADFTNVAIIAPLDYPHFARLMAVSHFMLTDSGGVQEEAPALGTPVLVMRDTTERPEGIAAGTALLVGSDAGRIAAAVARLLDDEAVHAAMARAHNPYGDGQASRRIVELLASA
jgi:UDP-N-acetylglucosamine 2-epimerase (non-hydrolysing)